MLLTERDVIDRAAILLGTGLMFLGIVVMGLIETFTGEPYGAAPITNDAGKVVAEPTIDPAIRTGLVVAGIVVLFVWGVYKIAVMGPEPEETAETDAEAAA